LVTLYQSINNERNTNYFLLEKILHSLSSLQYYNEETEMEYRDPHSYADLKQGTISHIDFDISVNFQNHKLSIINTYQFSKPINGPLFLDIKDLDIESINTKKGALEWEVDKRDDVLGQRLHIKGLSGVESIEIVFSTSPEASALQWLLPAQTAGKKQAYLFSQCQAIHARSVFPCQDSPGVRFTYKARVVVPAPMTAVMSAARERVDEEKGSNICYFDMPQPIPSYLFAIAVGNIAGKDLGSRSRIYAEPEVLEAAAWEFGKTEEMISEAEKLFGPYTWDRFDMLLMPPSFPYGGMENPRLTFLTPTLIIGDRSMTNVVAHELAHSWTGNLVTNATWEDFWLNEGWTVYAERRILQVLEGEDYVQLQSQIRQNSMFRDMELFGMESDPTRLNFSQEGIDPDDVFSTIPYEKGFSFLKRIEQIIGREKFDPFILKYIDTFKFKGINTEQFLIFLRENFPNIDDNINIKQWVFEPGFPQDGPAFHSSMLDAVDNSIRSFEEGKLPDRKDIENWRSEQIELFMQRLPRVLDRDVCRSYYELFDLGKTRNRNILSEFYQVAIASGYEDIIDGVEETLANVGRMLYLKPLYRALCETKWSKHLAREYFEKYKSGYHPIAAMVIESILKKASV